MSDAVTTKASRIQWLQYPVRLEDGTAVLPGWVDRNAMLGDEEFDLLFDSSRIYPG